MSTIDDKKIIADLIRNDGKYPDGVSGVCKWLIVPQMAAIYGYRSSHTGVLAGKVFYLHPHLPAMIEEMYTSPFVLAPMLLWSKDGGVTPEGEEWIQNFG